MWLDPQQVTKVTLDVDRDRDTGQLQVSITAHARSGPVEGSRTVAEGYRIHGPKYTGYSEPVLSATLTEQDVATIRAYLDLVSPPSPSGPDLATGADLIAAERRRQIDVEGWTPEHDAKHGPYDLARTAATPSPPAPADAVWPRAFAAGYLAAVNVLRDRDRMRAWLANQPNGVGLTSPAECAAYLEDVAVDFLGVRPLQRDDMPNGVEAG